MAPDHTSRKPSPKVGSTASPAARSPDPGAGDPEDLSRLGGPSAEADLDADPDADPDAEEPVAADDPDVAAVLGQAGVTTPAAPDARAVRSLARQRDIEATRRRSAELFVVLDDAGALGSSRAGARDDLVRLHLPLVEHCARRFRNRGEPYDDLVQVGTIGLIKSVDRFDSERGVEFSTYATPTIIGEIKRHFRDKGWAIRVPRRLQELRMQIGTATGELSQKLGRSPTPRELAEQIGVTVEEILEGIESSNAYSTLSLDAGDDSEDGASTMLDAIGVEDANLEHVEIRESLKPLIDLLEPREKKILLLRFFKNMTQSQIAEEIGVSQMHVSRLLTRTLEQLRTSLDPPA